MPERGSSIAELRRQFVEGEISSEELRDRLTELPQDTEKDELWVRWSGQGLFDQPIDRDGWTSFKNGQPEQRE